MKNYSLLFLLVIFFVEGFGQKSKGRLHFTEDGFQARGDEEIFFYREFEKQGRKFLVKDYYASNDKLKLEATCKKVKPALVFDGKVTKYFENGNLESISFYHENILYGKEEVFYESGKPKSEIIHHDGAGRYSQYWKEDGTPCLENGSGTFEEYNQSIVEHCIIEIKDSLRASSFYLNSQKDRIYTFLDQPAEYNGGLEAFYSGIGKVMSGRYPAEARRKGIQGKVLVKLILDKDGNVVNGSVLKGIGGGCDALALEAVTSQTDWIPAHHQGKPVYSVMVTPVTFRLR